MCEFIGKIIFSETFAILFVFVGTMAMTYHLAGRKLYIQKLENLLVSLENIRLHLNLPLDQEGETNDNYRNRVAQQSHKLGATRLRPATLSKLYFEPCLEQFGKLDQSLKNLSRLKLDLSAGSGTFDIWSAAHMALVEEVVNEINSTSDYLHKNKGELTNPWIQLAKTTNLFWSL